MKKTKLYAKKTLSVFMAVMMLMTAWVFVAPESGAVSTDVASVTSYASYHIKMKIKFSNCGKGGNIAVKYHPVNADGSLNDSVTDTYVMVNSATQYSSNVEYTFDTSVDSTRALASDKSFSSGGYDEGAERGPINGFPISVVLQSAGSTVIESNSNKITLSSLIIGDKQVILNGGSWSASKAGSKTIAYNNTGSGWDGYLDWPVPAVSQVTAPTAQTINVPKGGSNSATFTATFYDQYGVKWPSQTLDNVSISSQLGGVTVSESNNTATVSATEQVFANAGYNSSTGQITAKLNMTKSNVTGSCDVTFQSPKYNATLYYYNGSTAKTYSNIGYYNQSVTLTGHPANTTPTAIAGNEQQHQTYIWPTNSTSAFNITKDTTFTEEKDKTVDHTYGDYTQNADDHTRICTVCGYVQTQAHSKGTGYITTAETCTEDGVMTYDCAICGKKAIETSVIDKITGHDFAGAYILRTDGENGTHWKKCSRCDAYGLEVAHNWDKNGDGVIDAIDAETKASTCKEAGYEKYTCQVCSATWTKTLPLAKHIVKATAAKDATNICGGDGNKAFWTCTVCKRVWKDEALTDELTDTTDADSDGIPDALETKGPDHNFIGAYVNVSNGADGTHYRQCERFTQCGAYGLMVDGKAVVNATEAHKWGDPVTTPATCVKEGTKTYTCSGCNHSYTEELPLAAHEMTEHARVEAECNKPGNVEYYSCSVCNKNYDDEKGTNVVENIVISALQHKWTEHHDYDTLNTPATCQSPAVYNNHCDYCKVKLEGATHNYGEADEENGHNFNGTTRKNEDRTHSYKCTVEGCPEYGRPTDCSYEATKDVASTCKTRGYTTYECKYCHNGYSDPKPLDTENHKGEGTEVREQKDATCATNGYTGDTHCLGCGEKLETGSEIPADPAVYSHENMQKYEAKTSTCQEEGWKEYKYCSACNTYEIAKETIAKKAHKFTTYKSNNDGTHTAICDTCDPNVAEPETDTQDCTGGTANCVEKKVCTECKAEYGEVDSTNHKTEKTAAKVDSTCQKEGTEAYRYCEACGNDIETRVAIEKKAHIFGAWTKVDGENKHTRSCTTCNADVADVATQTEYCNGGIAYCNALAKCADCKAEYGDYDEDNHSTEANTLKDVVDATCQKEGFSGNYRYNCCDAIKEAGKVTEKLAHKFDIEVEGSRVAATCIAKGEVTYKCSTCDPDVAEPATEKKELPIDAKNHATPDKTVTIGAKDATCEEDGHTGDVYYECCYDADASAAENKKALKEKGTTIKANGQHVYDAAVPEYMIAEIRDVKDEDGNVTGKEIVRKDTEPAYADKIKARRDDDKWYHAKQCNVCGTIEYEACYTYEHTYSCVDTDTCEVCEGLCSLKDPDKHTNIVKVPKVEATHTTDGTKEYYKCEDCGKFFLDEAGKKPFDPASDEGKELIKISKDTVPCTEWEKDPFETVEPKCGQDGYKKYHCAVEGCDKVKTEVIPAESDSHTWSEDYKVIKEPTCGAVGYKTLYCTVCDEFKPNSTVTISATGEHSYKLVDTDKGTSCLDPTIEIYECEVCGAEKTETVYDGDANHNWGEWEAVGGDCSTGIIQQRECSVCHEKQQQTVTTDTHDYELTTRVEPTPEADGYVIYTCKNCGAEKREELPYSGSGEGGTETDHKHLIDENNYTVAKEASCDHGEIRRYVCLRCGETVEKEIEGTLLDHVWLEQAEEKATCAKDGHSAYYRCVRCLAEYGEGKEIYPATGHKDGNGDGKCDSCNSAFYEDGNGSKTCGCICHKEGFLMKIIYKIVRFFWKLFKIGHSCDCGAVHY